MAHNASRAAHRHHGVLRSIGAVFLGLAVIFILSLGMDQLMHSLEIYPPWDQPMVDVEDGLLALGYRTPIAIFGCYLAARFAPRAPMAHALVLGGIGVVLSTLGAVAMWQMGMHWYPIALILISLPCAWIGGKLYLARKSGSR
ncbi:hypothetical protein SAMN05216452_1147 [Nitratireductor aquibiodomus]|uniref:Uncharacterized protein n=1 Tax=Nitratireductor aquibiodomus TaxID=204799 RepID=A0A1H4JBE4_9HYPH|nr:hypothetical protein [Nitratireductor aquibiodomus]SEB42902.1 hypothetical protein SAMN05216452_1147 [Nitratireductor aquibiodomus]